jgi:hypothetical protein
MHVKTPSAKRTVVDFLREEAPLELERLTSIGQLIGVQGDRPDQFSYERWVWDAFGRFAI